MTRFYSAIIVLKWYGTDPKDQHEPMRLQCHRRHRKPILLHKYYRKYAKKRWSASNGAQATRSLTF